MVMLKATSPLEYRVKRLLVLPPGVAPIAIIDIACNFGAKFFTWAFCEHIRGTRHVSHR